MECREVENLTNIFQMGSFNHQPVQQCSLFGELEELLEATKQKFESGHLKVGRCSVNFHFPYGTFVFLNLHLPIYH